MTEFDKAAGAKAPIEHKQVATRAGVFVPVLKERGRPEEGADIIRRSDEDRLIEAEGLAAAIDLEIVARGIIPSRRLSPRP